MFFIAKLEKAIRQGQTSYNYLVLQLKQDDSRNIELKCKPDLRQDYFGDSKMEELDGYLHDIVSIVFKQVAKCPIVVPSGYKSATGKSGFKCSVKAQGGIFYPLSNSVIFVHKPMIYIRNSDIIIVNFNEVGAKSFEIEIVSKEGKFSFSNIEKSEMDNLRSYFLASNVKLNTSDNSNVKPKQPLRIFIPVSMFKRVFLLSMLSPACCCIACCLLACCVICVGLLTL